MSLEILLFNNYKCYGNNIVMVEQAYEGTIGVTCVYRCPVHNSHPNVRGSRTSKHLLGKAFDFDQLSSEANWDVAKKAYDKNSNWEILLYINGEKTPFSPSIPRTPPQGVEYEHGHVGI